MKEHCSDDMADRKGVAVQRCSKAPTAVKERYCSAAVSHLPGKLLELTTHWSALNYTVYCYRHTSVVFTELMKKCNSIPSSRLPRLQLLNLEILLLEFSFLPVCPHLLHLYTMHLCTMQPGYDASVYDVSYGREVALKQFDIQIPQYFLENATENCRRCH